MVVALLDLGTNTFHLLLFKWRGDQVELLHKEKQIVQLGRERSLDQAMSPEALQRARSVLQKFSQKISSADVDKVVAVGTSAFRTARNGAEVAQVLSQETTIPIEIISGQKEAYLIYKGTQTFLPQKGVSLIVDIGGGSIECIICDQKQMYWSESFEIGAQRLLTQFGTEDPLPDTQRTALMSYLTATLGSLSEMLSRYAPEYLMGCSGTFVTLAKIHALTQHVPAEEVFRCTPQAFQAIYRPLITMNRVERLEVPGMPVARVDMIVVASLFLEYMLSLHSFKQVYVPPTSLREGMLQDFIAKQKHYESKAY